MTLAWKDVSPLGLGTVKFGRNRGVKYPGGDGFALPTDAEISNLLDVALDCGINLLDTAPAYGSSEERLGGILGPRRDKFFLVTKTGEEFDGEKSEYIFTAAHTRMSVERSLRRLRTDYLDAVLVHSSRDDLRVIGQTPVLETLAQLKAEGRIGSFGVSTYTVEGGKKALDLSDCVMAAFNKNYLDEKPVLDYAAQLGKPALVKKGLASGHIGAPAETAENLRFVAATPGVACIVFGSLREANIRANAAALRGRKA